jgi:hypothetical protein
MNRRDFLWQGSLTVAGLAAMGAAQEAGGAEVGNGRRAVPAKLNSSEAQFQRSSIPAKLNSSEAQFALPMIKLGSVEVSRLILGSNPFYGFAHQTEALAKEMSEYYTDERIAAVLDEAAAQGITAVASPPYERWIRLFNDYLEQGGKLRVWIAQPDGPADRMDADLDASVKGGAKAVFIQGARVDEQFQGGTFEVVRGWVERIKGQGVPAGLASHRPDVHLEAERQGFPTDFYFQCFFNPSQGYQEEDRQKVVEAIRQIAKPVVGYKILGAGRLPAQEAFAFAWRHLREKDGVCVGMFPKHDSDQVEEDARLARRLSEKG